MEFIVLMIILQNNNANFLINIIKVLYNQLVSKITVILNYSHNQLTIN